MSSSNFASTYQVFDMEPWKYLARTSYGRAALSRLQTRKEYQFASDETKIEVPIKTISADGTVDKINLFNDDDVRGYLGDIPSQSPSISDGTSPVTDRKVDKCRFIHLLAPHTVGPLNLDTKILLRLLTFYQVMPQLLDFLNIYSSPHGEDRELRFSGFRTEKALTNPSPETIIPELGRSGRRYQICLNLKTVAQKSDGNWKIRQAVVHHQFDVGHGIQLWIIGDPHKTLKDRITSDLYALEKSYPQSFSTMSQSFGSSLDVMLDFAEWAAAEWRWHILFLEKRAEELTMSARVRERGHIENFKPHSASLGDVQKWEERTNDTIMAMESNVNIMKLLQRFYKDLVRDVNFPSRELHGCQTAVENFSFRLEELIHETQMQVMRAKVLVKLVADRKTILIQHLQTQSAIISSRLAATMFDQADRSAMEAIAVRIVTVVTMIYLPATFSSTFFSTDIVKYQGGELFSEAALVRFLQVTLPLMFLTFVPAGVWFWIELRRRTATSREIKRGPLADVFPEPPEKN